VKADGRGTDGLRIVWQKHPAFRRLRAWL